MAGHLLRLAEAHGAKILLTTSRRTGLEAERSLQRSLGVHPALIQTTYFNHKPERVMAKYLGAADLVFCTAESGTMLSEAIATGKATYAMIPSNAKPSAFYQTFLASHVNAGRLKTVSMDQLDAIDPRSDLACVFHLLAEDPITSLAKQLRPWLTS